MQYAQDDCIRAPQSSTNPEMADAIRKSRNAQRREKQRERRKTENDQPTQNGACADPSPLTRKPDKNVIFDLILKEFKGSCTVKHLMNMDLFGEGIPAKAIVSWLVKSQKFKVIPGSQDAELSVVKVHDGRMRLCYKYPDACFKAECQYFHLCKGFVAGCCSRRNNPSCRSCHRIAGDSHNSRLVDKLQFTSYDENEIRCIISCTCLQVCSAYNRSECPNVCLNDNLTCPNVHICANYVKNECPSQENCPYHHTLKTRDTKALLNIYYMTKIEESTIMKMLIVPTIEGQKPKKSKTLHKGVTASKPTPVSKVKEAQHAKIEKESIPIESRKGGLMLENTTTLAAYKKVIIFHTFTRAACQPLFLEYEQYCFVMKFCISLFIRTIGFVKHSSEIPALRVLCVISCIITVHTCGKLDKAFSGSLFEIVKKRKKISVMFTIGIARYMK